VPQIYFDANRTECLSKEVALRDLFDTLQIYMGSLYVNDFNRFGRTWQVIVQAEPRFRNTVDSIRRLKVRNAQGAMVPLGGLADVREVNGPLVLTRYNMYPAAPINGNAAPGVSSGEAMDVMDRLADDTLISSMKTEWTELAFLERQAGNTAMVIFGFAVVMVFLVLAAQYESWSMPLAIILVVPMCLLSAIAGVRIAGDDINIFTRIGFVVLVGLASKNAILIVEFARHQHEGGMSLYQATLAAVKLRLRPIVMTSLAFILGTVPLLITHGAGAEMRRTLGTTVFSGMLGVTVFGVFLTPVFFFVIGWLSETRLFASRAVHRIGLIALYALTLGILPMIYWIPLIFRELRRPSPQRKPPVPDPDFAEDPELVEQK
jgi:multidrug efflux pump